MGRPLRWQTLEKMELKATSAEGEVTLGKQIGYNKYLVEEDPRKLVRLASELVEPYDAVMTLKVGDNEEKVLKITRRIFVTEEGVHAYSLDEDGKVVFAEEDVSFASDEASSDKEPTSDGEPNEG